MKFSKTITLIATLVVGFVNAADELPTPDELTIEGVSIQRAPEVSSSMSDVQLDLSELKLDEKSLNSLLKSGEATVDSLKESSSVMAYGSPCVYVNSETPIYNLAVQNFVIIRQYTTSCSSGVHSIQLTKTSGGLGLLRAYIYKYNGSTWVPVSNSGTYASFTGPAGSYMLVAANEGLHPVSGKAKTKQAL